MGRRLDTALLLSLALSVALGVFFWHSWFLFPFKLLVVLMHESGHAAAALLAGGVVEKIQVSPDEGGVTWSRFNPTLFHQVLVSSAGYVGSTVSGCLLLFVASRSKEARLPLYLLAAWTGGVALLFVRDTFTLLFTLGCTTALLVLARLDLPAVVRRALLAFLAAFSVLYALYDIKDDLLHFASRGGGQSDADALAKATFIPAIVWGVGWGLFSIALVIYTLRLALAKGARQGVPASLPPRQAALRR
jgi:Peptidase M50B-like